MQIRVRRVPPFLPCLTACLGFKVLYVVKNGKTKKAFLDAVVVILGSVLSWVVVVVVVTG